MCVSVGPARFEGTRVAAWERLDSHYLLYQNTYGPGGQMRRSGGPGNAMLLHIPCARFADMQALDISACPHILDDMERSLYPQGRQGVGRSIVGARSFAKGQSEVLTVGSYTVINVEYASDISVHLDAIPEDHRPPDNPALFAWYEREYPGWCFSFWCFNSGQWRRAHPALLRYTPRYPDVLFIPGLDAHDGKPPRVGEDVATDHLVCFSVDRHRGWSGNFGAQPPDLAGPAYLKDQTWVDVAYRDPLPPALADVVPQAVMGVQTTRSLPNGDFVASHRDLRLGFLNVARYSPRDWPQMRT